MSTKELDAIKAQLEEQKEQTSAQAEKLRTELSDLEDKLARYEGALAVLSGTPIPTQRNVLAKKEARKALPPSANKEQVIQLVTKELSRVASLDEADLKSRIEKQLVESGYGRMGYSLRFKEALADSRFLIAKDGVSLRRANSSCQIAQSISNGHERSNA